MVFCADTDLCQLHDYFADKHCRKKIDNERYCPLNLKGIFNAGLEFVIGQQAIDELISVSLNVV